MKSAAKGCYTAPVRRLIVNADDLGLTDGINRAVVEAHAKGIVTSATLMAGGSARESAVALSSCYPRLSVGCHVVLVDGSPLSAPSQVATLLNRSDDRVVRFCDSLSTFARRALSGRLSPDDVESEAIAQIRLVQKGIQITHVDTHKHTHVFPSILKPLLRAAQACGVRAIRNPFEPRMPIPIRDLRRRPKLWKRFLEVKLLQTFASTFRKSVAESGLRTPDGSFGVVSTGALDAELFRAIAQVIPDGTWEFVCHPGYNDPDLAFVRTRLRASREQELDVLTSAEAREALELHGIQLISYREL